MEILLQHNSESIFAMEIPTALLSLLYTESAHTVLVLLSYEKTKTRFLNLKPSKLFFSLFDLSSP